MATGLSPTLRRAGMNEADIKTISRLETIAPSWSNDLLRNYFFGSVLSQKHEAVRRLAGHFAWPEFGESERRACARRRAHQHFVHDAAQFTWTRGFRWSDVIRATAMAKDLFPQLNDLDVPGQLILLDEACTQRLPDLTALHRCQLIWFLADYCVVSRPLLAAVAAANVSTEQVHLEVQVPVRPPPLAQGVTLEEAELRRRQAELAAAVERAEHRLEAARRAARVSRAPEVNGSGVLDAEGVQELVRATAGQVSASLRQEAALVADLLELRLQCAGSAGRGRHSPALPPRASAKPARQAPGGKGRRK